MSTNISFGSANVQSNVLDLQQRRLMAGSKSLAELTDAKIDKGARDFEAVLVGSWLQQAEKSFATVPGAEDDENAGQRDQTMSFGVQSLANSLAASGAIGIGKMVSRAMHSKVSKAQDDTAVSPSVHGQTRTFEKNR